MTSSNEALSKCIEEISVAHLCNILIYSRNKFSSKLAKAIRPEVARIFLASEAKDCINIIKKQNRHIESTGVNIVIIDADPSALKLIEYLDERSKNPKFSGHPILPIVVLYYGDENDFKKNIEIMGVTITKYIEAACPPKEIFAQIVAILYQQRLIDNAYREIQQTQHAKAYPYLPIFEANKDIETSDDEVDDDDDDDDDEDSIMDEFARFGGTLQHRSASGISVFELDDWTDSIVILPGVVTEARDAQTLNSFKDFDEFDEPTKEILLKREVIERNAKDYAILKRLSNNREHDFIANEIESNIQKIQSPSNKPIDDTISTKISSSMKKRTSVIIESDNNRRINLLDTRRRPKWEAKRGRRNKSIGAGLTDAEVTLYFDRQPPNLTTARTVGGLNRRRAEYCWNVFNAYGNLSKIYLQEGSEVNDTASQSSMDKSLKSAQNDAAASQLATPVDGKSILSSIKTLSFVSSPVSPGIEKPVSPDASKSGLNMISLASAMTPSNKLSSNNNQLSLQHPSTINRDDASNVHSVVKITPKDLSDSLRKPQTYREMMKKAERMLRRLVKETPPDVQISRTIDVDLSNRNVNKWEKGLIEEGKQAELDGLLDHAVSSITRAGINSKEPHLSKLFLGTFCFRTGKYLSAIDNFTDSLRMLTSLKSSSMYNKDDEFIGKFNRAIAYFRCGNDKDGIKDLEEALKLDPKNLTGLEVYAIVLRRLGRYDEAIKVKEEYVASVNANMMNRSHTSFRRPGTANSTALMTLNNNDDSAAMTPIPTPNKRSVSRKGLLLSLSGINSTDGPKSNRSNRSGRSLNTPTSGRDMESNIIDHPIYINLPEPRGFNMSLKEKKLIMKHQESNETKTNDYVESLTAFKLINGFKETLFDSLFVKPDILQESLLIPPSKRSLSNIQVIGTNLKLIPLFHDLSSNIIAEIASKIEYRTLLPKTEIFQQNSPCDAFCIVIKGTVQMSMEGVTKGTQNIVIGPDLSAGDIFGHIDLLFQNQDSYFMNELKKRLKDNESDNHKKTMSNHIISSNKQGTNYHQTIQDSNDDYNHYTKQSDNYNNHGGNKDQATVTEKQRVQLHTPLNKKNRLSKSFGLAMIKDSRPSLYMLKRQNKLRFDDDSTNSPINSNHNESLSNLKSLNRSSDHSKSKRDVHRINHDQSTNQINRMNSHQSHRSQSTTTDIRSTPIIPLNDLFHGLNYNSMNLNHSMRKSSLLNDETVQRQPSKLTNLQRRPSISITNQQPLISLTLDEPSTGSNHNHSIPIKSHRSLSSGMFTTYTTQTYSEVLLLTDKDFNKLLFNLTINNFRKRYDVLKSSGIFTNWSDYDLIRLCRMGWIKSYKQNDIILKQKDKPYHLCFILNGVCKAYKSPNRIEVLERKLIEAKTKAENYDQKYSYHHKLRNTIEHIPVIDVLQSVSSSYNQSVNPAITSLNHQHSVNNPTPLLTHQNTITHLKSSSLSTIGISSLNNQQYGHNYIHEYHHKNSSTKVISADITSKITKSEAERFKLQLEIQQLEYMLHRLTHRSSVNHGSSSRPSGTINKSQPNTPLLSNNNQLFIDDDNNCELSTMKWPMMFGEACVLEPDIGVSRGSIIASTSCEIFMIHKTQLQTFHINDEFLKSLQKHSIIYPEDDIVVDIMMKKKLWNTYRQQVIDEIPKNRWPKEKDLIDPFI